MKSPRVSVPVVATVDVAIVGASTSTVAAALAARESGASVFVVSDRPYFGEETAGRLELWNPLESGDPLLKSLGNQRPLTPGAYKRGLETALLDQGIPFLFLTRPVAVLRGTDGELAGLVLASRTSLYAVRAKVIVDTSAFGLVARLAEIALPAERPGQEQADLVILADQLPKGWENRAESAGSPLLFPEQKADTPDRKFEPYRLSLPVPQHAGEVADYAALEHKLRAEVLDPAIAYSGDSLALQPTRALAPATFSDPLALPDEAFQLTPELFLLGGLLPLTNAGLALLERSEIQAHLGRRVGALAASAASGRELATLAPAAETGAEYHFAEAFQRGLEDAEFITVTLPTQPLLGSYDVVVAGGGTGGASAAISAARTGAKTVVLEVQQGLGGVGTLGLIANYWFGNRVGFTAEIDQALAVLESRGVAEPKVKSGWNSELKMSWYHHALAEAGGEAWLRSFAFGVRMEGDRVDGVLVSTPYGSGLVETGSVVDATGNADIAAAAGAPCQVLGARHVAVQGSGLSPRKPGYHYRNSDHTFIDDCDVAGVTHAFVNARAKFPAEFDTASLVDTRERRQIQGEIELSPLDFLAQRQFPDTVNIAKSNFDTHGFTVHPVFLLVPPDKAVLSANVPFRCLLPQGVEGVIVTGLGMSAHRDAIPVVRMQADVQNQGFAAGLAASMAAAGTKRLRDLDIRVLQKRLVEEAILPEGILTQEDTFPLPASALESAAEAGPGDLFNAAVLFANPERSTPLLLQRLQEETDPVRRENIALVLGFLGSEEAAPALAEAVQARNEWDKGWNYTGMGQFGMSNSRLDALLIALGRTGSPLAVQPVLEKIQALGADPEFSHCRAVALAAACLEDAQLGAALTETLAKPGLAGHAHLETAQVVQAANDNLTETDARNTSLRELYLARGIYLAGDAAGVGRRTLETYARDLRGPYARHATAILTGAGAGMSRMEMA